MHPDPHQYSIFRDTGMLLLRGSRALTALVLCGLVTFSSGGAKAQVKAEPIEKVTEVAPGIFVPKGKAGKVAQPKMKPEDQVKIKPQPIEDGKIVPMKCSRMPQKVRICQRVEVLHHNFRLPSFSRHYRQQNILCTWRTQSIHQYS